MQFKTFGSDTEACGRTCWFLMNLLIVDGRINVVDKGVKYSLNIFVWYCSIAHHQYP